jgi:hypothetical protein
MELADVDQRRQRVQAALDQARAADEARRQQGVNPETNPAQVPTTDPDSRVMPNKEGGYAPNYTPIATTDGERGFIVDCDVLAEVNEGSAARMSRESSRKLYNQRPRIAETTFGILKLVMGFRQFLLRGLEKVKTEWLWAATAFNLMKLSRELGKLRAEFTKLAAAEQN